MADQPRNDHIATVAALRRTMTREQFASALYEADMADFHAHEAASAPPLPHPGPDALAALKAHLTDGAGHQDLQRELLAAHVALHRGDWESFWLGVLAHYKCALGRIPKPAIDAALAPILAQPEREGA